jgi:histidinol dehydrogenase
MKRLATSEAGFPAAFQALLDDARDTTTRVDAAVSDIIAAIRAGGDDALCAATAKFDRLDLTPDRLAIRSEEIESEVAKVTPELLAALDLAATRIEAFHRAQMPIDMQMHDDAGLTMGLRWTPLDSVGLYVPGGKAAYPSSVLMNALPAHVVRAHPRRRAEPAGAGGRQARRGQHHLPCRRRAGHRRNGLWHADHRRRRPYRRPRQCLCR